MEDSKEYRHLMKRKEVLDFGPKILILLGVVFFILSAFVFFLMNRKSNNSLSPDIAERKIAELARASVRIGSDKVIRGVFREVKDGILYLQEGRKLNQYELTDEVVVRCSSQEDLSSSEKYYLDDITAIEVVGPDQVSEKVSMDSAVVVFAENVDNARKVYAIVKNEGCPPKDI